MDNLFYILWLADFVGNVGIVGISICLAIVIGGAIAMFAILIDDDCCLKISRFKTPTIILVSVLTVCVLMPSRTTIQLLAVSEASKQAAQSQIGAKVIEAIDAVLNRVIKDKK
jgi:hypothetical protein